MKRINCPFCNARVTVGAASRIYKHKTPQGKNCIAGHGIKYPLTQAKEINNEDNPVS